MARSKITLQLSHCYRFDFRRDRLRAGDTGMRKLEIVETVPEWFNLRTKTVEIRATAAFRPKDATPARYRSRISPPIFSAATVQDENEDRHRERSRSNDAPAPDRQSESAPYGQFDL